MTTAEEAAAKGEAFLDEYWQGWRETVNPVILDMARNDLCIGGQLSGNGDFWTFAARVHKILGISYEEFQAWAVEHGFLIPDPGYWPDEVDRSYAGLNAAWRAILA